MSHTVYVKETERQMAVFTDPCMMPVCYWTRERHDHLAQRWPPPDSLYLEAHQPTRTHADTGSHLYQMSARSRGLGLSTQYLADTQVSTDFTHSSLAHTHNQHMYTQTHTVNENIPHNALFHVAKTDLKWSPSCGAHLGWRLAAILSVVTNGKSQVKNNHSRQSKHAQLSLASLRGR